MKAQKLANIIDHKISRREFIIYDEDNGITYAMSEVIGAYDDGRVVVIVVGGSVDR